LSIERTPFKMLHKPAPPFPLTIHNTALLISDLQRLTVDDKGGIAKLSRLKGVISEFKDYYVSIQKVVNNVSKILERSRQLGLEVIFTRIVSKKKDGADIGQHTSIWDENFPYNPEDEAFSIHNKENEPILDKVCSNPFNCTELDNLLRTLGVEYLILCGVRSPGYLDTIAFDAADRGFGVIVVSDACAGGTPNGTQKLTGGMIRVRNTRSILETLEYVDRGDQP